VAACHCMECQRRTGSAVGASTYFPKEQVRTEGTSKVYVRGSDSGRKGKLHFCPSCGSTVFWYGERFPDLIGIAFGAFADPSMPWPTASVWETTRNPWVTFDHGLHHFVRQFERVEGPATARRHEPYSISSRVRTVSIPGHIRNSG
jgi:hypothetical protein